MNLIVSVDDKWGIGKNGNLIFRARGDVEFFKAKTTGNAVIMGRKTLDSLPEKKPLKNRVNIVMTRSRDFARDDVIICHSVAEALKEAEKYSDVFVIGGGEIYRQFLTYCDTAYVTRFLGSAPADTFMVNLDKAENWKLQRFSDFSENGLDYRICVYKNTSI